MKTPNTKQTLKYLYMVKVHENGQPEIELLDKNNDLPFDVENFSPSVWEVIASLEVAKQDLLSEVNASKFIAKQAKLAQDMMQARASGLTDARGNVISS